MTPTLKQIFLVFLKMGTFAIGGVYSMLSFFHKELVERRGWLTDEEFADGVAIGQMTPGPPIVNTGIYVGYRLRGFKGAVAATAGQIFPGLMLVLALGLLYIRYKEAPVFSSALKGVGAAVVGLLVSIIFKMSRQMLKGRSDILFAVLAFVLLSFFKVNPIALIFIAGFSGYLVYGGVRR